MGPSSATSPKGIRRYWSYRDVVRRGRDVFERPVLGGGHLHQVGRVGGAVAQHRQALGGRGGIHLAGEAVVQAMAAALDKSEGRLTDRLLAALAAGQEAGGDTRGQHSAAILIVRKGRGYGGFGDRMTDLRVDDHLTPIAELKRLVDIRLKRITR